MTELQSGGSISQVTVHRMLTGGLASTAAILSFMLPGTSRSASADLSWQDSPKAIVDEAWQIVNREYVDRTFNRVDWEATRRELLSREYTSREQAYAAIREALERLQDPYTRFMDPKQFQALTSQTSGELSGIGIRLEVDPETKFLRIVEPLENSPADQAGLRPGDRILDIDGRSTQGMSTKEASDLIRGEIGTKIVLKIKRSSQDPFQVTLTRALIALPTVRYSVKHENGVKIGYIHLSDFSSHAAEQMQQAIRDLSNQNVKAFVLDLRGNPGGLLQASIEIARMWLNDGPIVRTTDRQGRDEEVRANRTALTDLPLVVLVDGNSASSSEILTGALKDNRRALVVGSQTFGKALVQSVHPLSDGSGLAVTVAHYYTPNGTDINRTGIQPDVAIDLTRDQRNLLASNPALVGTNQDPQYVQAISTLRATAQLAVDPSSMQPTLQP